MQIAENDRVVPMWMGEDCVGTLNAVNDNFGVDGNLFQELLNDLESD